jgi:hypothetical protein
MVERLRTENQQVPIRAEEMGAKLGSYGYFRVNSADAPATLDRMVRF